MNNLNLIEFTSPAPLDEVCRRFPEIAQSHKFGVLGVHDLKEKMNSKGVPFARECRVFEVCNPHQAKKVLEHAMEVSTALPCRVAVYERDGRTVLATIKPTNLLGIFNLPEAADIACEVEETLVRIMKEAAAA